MTKRYSLSAYICGAAAARTGDEMSGPALLLAGLAATGSASTASSLLAGIMISATVGGPVFGVLVDRSPRPGRLLARAIAAYASALLVVLATLGRAPVAVTVLIAVGAGLLGPALSGGWTSQLPRVVAREDLSRANALDAMTFSLASLMGPALSAIVAELAGGSAGVVVAVALICLALPSALTLPAAQERTRNQPTTAIAADLTAGFRAINQSSPLARATTSSVISCAAEGMLVACTPLLGQQDLGAADRGTLLLSGIAASALAANAVLARHSRLIRPDTVIWCSAFGIAVGLALAATGRPVLLIAAMLLIGASQGPQLTALFAIRHREAPGHLRGQIFTTGASLKITGFAVGAGIAGPIAIRSLSNALLAAAGLQVLAVVCTTWRSRARLLGHSPGK